MKVPIVKIVLVLVESENFDLNEMNTFFVE